MLFGEAAMKSLFDIASLRVSVRVLSRFFLWVTGWRAVNTIGEIPAHCVIVGAPHTSGWDLAYGIALASVLGIRPTFLTKHEYFQWPIVRDFMYFVGAVPVDRSNGSHAVDESITSLTGRKPIVHLVVAPEGTRKRVEKWKTGAFRIAHASNVDIVLGYLDYTKKEGGLVTKFRSSGNYEEDVLFSKTFYIGTQGKHRGI